jgi:transposase
MDMSVPFRIRAMMHAPQANIVHCRFHFGRDLNEAVDKVQWAEHQALRKYGIDTLKGSKQLWLFHAENLSEIRLIEFKRPRQMELKTSKDCAM